MGDIRALLFASGNDPGGDTGARQDRRGHMQWDEIQRSVGGGPLTGGDAHLLHCHRRARQLIQT